MAKFQAIQVKALLPGFILALIIGLIARFLGQNYGAPPMLFALLIGIAFSFLSESEKFRPGINWTGSFVLRVGVAFLGLRLSLHDFLTLGWDGAFLILIGIASTILLGNFLARRLGLSPHFGTLSGGSVSICGVSAAMAVASVLPHYKNKERDLSLTIIGVTSLSTIAMVLYPAIAEFLHLDLHETGIFIGGTIHDVAQVVGAGYSVSEETGNLATLTKLVRVSFLVPVVLGLSVYLKSGPSGEKKGTKLPLFLVVFIAFMILNSFVSIPENVKTGINSLTSMALVVSIAAIGLKSRMRQLLEVGIKPVILIVAETVWLGVLVLSVLTFL